MNPTHRKMIKALHEKYPSKHICISTNNDYYAHSDKYKVNYFVYVENVENKHLPTLSEVKLYVEYLCKKGGIK